MGCDHAAFAMVVPFCMPDCFTDATNSDNGTAGERGGRPSPQLAGVASEGGYLGHDSAS
eukprot:COSAG02_NODE_41469_length_394_cov_0.908475_1_plen_58_part_10